MHINYKWLIASIIFIGLSIQAVLAETSGDTEDTVDIISDPWDRNSIPMLLKAGEETYKYLYMLAETSGASQYASIVVEKVGDSSKNRPILMMSVYGKDNSKNSRKNVMVVATQHGDEPAGMIAMLELARSFVASREASIEMTLEKVNIHIIPVANPDGSNCFSRRTAGNRDLNRNWNTCSLPEAGAIISTIERLRPDVLLDLHELTPRDNGAPFVAGVMGSGDERFLKSVRYALHNAGIRASVRYESEGNCSLLHRQFFKRFGKPALLVESKYHIPDRNIRVRSNMHIITVLAVVEELARQ